MANLDLIENEGLVGAAALRGAQLQALLHEAFDEHPLVRRVLKDESIPAQARLDALWARTTEKNWDAVRTAYDPGAWIPESTDEDER